MSGESQLLNMCFPRKTFLLIFPLVHQDMPVANGNTVLSSGKSTRCWSTAAVAKVFLQIVPSKLARFSSTGGLDLYPLLRAPTEHILTVLTVRGLRAGG